MIQDIIIHGITDMDMTILLMEHGMVDIIIIMDLIILTIDIIGMDIITTGLITTPIITIEIEEIVITAHILKLIDPDILQIQHLEQQNLQSELQNQ